MLANGSTTIDFWPQPPPVSPAAAGKRATTERVPSLQQSDVSVGDFGKLPKLAALRDGPKPCPKLQDANENARVETRATIT
jgi:hypothetical protein